MQHSDTLTDLIPALIKAKLGFGPILKNKNNPAFKSKYADLDAVLEAVEPSLLTNGLILIQPTMVVDGKQRLVTLLMHESGEFLRSEWDLNPVKNDPQGEGSAMTYGRRYAVLAILGIAPEDDDGNAARREPPPPAQPERTDEEWIALSEKCADVESIKNLGYQANAAGKFTGAVKTAFIARKAALEAEAKAAAEEPAQAPA